MSNSFSRLSFAALAVGFLVGAGCGSGGLPPMARSTGTVTYQGAPVEGAKVMFHPVDGGARSSYGVTDSEGKFTMSTFGLNDGALLGKQKVTIAKGDTSEFEQMNSSELVNSGGYGGSDMYEKMMAKSRKGDVAKHLLPEKYAHKLKSGIEIEVSDSGENDFTFNLE